MCQNRSPAFGLAHLGPVNPSTLFSARGEQFGTGEETLSGEPSEQPMRCCLAECVEPSQHSAPLLLRLAALEAQRSALQGAPAVNIETAHVVALAVAGWPQNMDADEFFHDALLNSLLRYPLNCLHDFSRDALVSSLYGTSSLLISSTFLALILELFICVTSSSFACSASSCSADS